MHRASTNLFRVLAVLAGMTAAAGTRADSPYWVCVDESGRKSVQDEACSYAPDAPPSGRTVVPRPQEKGERKVGPPVRERGMDVGAYWSRSLRKLFGVSDVLPRRSIYIGLGVLGTAVLGALLWRELRRMLRQRRIERAGRAEPDRYKAAFGGMVHEAEVQAAKVAEAAPPKAEVPTRWTPTVLRDLTPIQFGALCQRLWLARGMRAESSPGKRLGDTIILLRHPAQVGQLHGVVLCRTRHAGMLGWDAAQDVSDLMQLRGCEYGALMSPGEFDLAARDYVRGKQIELKGMVTLMAELDALTDERRAYLLRYVITADAAATASGVAA